MRSKTSAVGWLVGCACLLVATPASATVLPPGFVETEVASLGGPAALAFDPDGGLWISEHATGDVGFVHVLRQGSLHLALTLATDSVGDRGIHALAVDPDYATNSRIWIWYSAPSPPARNRLSHFTNVSDLLLNEVVVLEGPDLANALHNGGCLAFASDKTLFLGIGEDNQGSNYAQDPFDIRGKILHINRDGTPVPGNPYFDGTAGDPRVWALGFRNPYRCICNRAWTTCSSPTSAAASSRKSTSASWAGTTASRSTRERRTTPVS